MATSPRDRLKRQREMIEERTEEDEISREDCERILEFSQALDEMKVKHKFITEKGVVKTLAPRSISVYIRCLRICCEHGFQLRGSTPEDFNDLIAELHDECGKQKVTLQTYQAAAQSFYQYHDDLDFDVDEIQFFNDRSKPAHDELDMFTEEEVEALRRGCGQTKMATRNRAILELLIFTGQRIRALMTLRIKDVDIHNGYIYLNDELANTEGGLKGALRRGRKRPIFGARKFVRDWLQYHPRGDDRDEWLFIGDPNHWNTDPDDHLAVVSADQVLRHIGRYAEVDKPVNANNFRHYCATVLYRDYDLDRDTIRMLFGHVKGSSVLEETYSHLFEEDYIQRAEEALGYKEQEERSPLTPQACTTCGELLKDHWRRCPSCSEVYAPDLQASSESIEEAKGSLLDVALSVADDLTSEERQAVRALIDMTDEPVRFAEALETTVREN